MKPKMRTIEDKALLLLLVGVGAAFTWILLPFYGAVLWGVVLAIVFAPPYRRLLTALGGRTNFAASVTVLLILTIVILPLLLIGAALVQEASSLFGKMQSGVIDPVQFLQKFLDALPRSAVSFLDRFGLASTGGVQEKLSVGLIKSSQFIAAQILNIGQGTFDFVANLFVMLYLLFFLLRDGNKISNLIKNAIPLRDKHQRALLVKFAVVIRATVKGDMVVALIQGALGGLIFWTLGIGAPLLWSVVMAFFSLLPAVGTSLVWMPVAIYLLATGAIWQGIVLIMFGALVIGLVDNVLRPILVGKDTKMPDYVVLLSTLGGIEAFGLNGFVIGPTIAAMFIATWDIYLGLGRDAQLDRADELAAPTSKRLKNPHRRLF